MSELEDKLSQVLSNPQMMQAIASMAARSAFFFSKLAFCSGVNCFFWNLFLKRSAPLSVEIGLPES